MPLSLFYRFVAAACSCACAASVASGQTPGFWLVGIPPGATSSRVQALSQDGRTAGGQGGGLTTGPGFLWTAAGGRNDFGLDPGMPPISGAFAMSSDGSVVAGIGGTSTGLRAFRWSGPGTYQDLGLLPG